jgi:hypothetical protein
MARLCCKPIGLVNLQLPLADVPWFIPCVLASIAGLFFCCTWPSCFRPFFSLDFPTTTTFFNMLRSSVYHTTLASIIGVHKGFRQPSFKGAVGHDMTEIRHRKVRAVLVSYQFFGFFFIPKFAAFIIRERSKAGREFKTAALK